jgi:uncharacterized surface protein with fasciclin (FAS1) repeats
MKRAMLAALAALSLVGQLDLAEAAGGRRSARPDAVRRVETERIARQAGTGTGAVAHEAATIRRELDNSGLTNTMKPEQSRTLNELLTTEGDIRAKAREILANKDSALSELNTATLEGLSNLKGIQRDVNAQAIAALNPAARAEQGYVTLVMSASTQAKTWSPELRANLTLLLTSANNHIASGKSRAEAMKEAIKELEQSKGVKLNIEDISKFCKV